MERIVTEPQSHDTVAMAGDVHMCKESRNSLFHSATDAAVSSLRVDECTLIMTF